MDRSTFETRLRTAAQQAVQFARQFVREVLPDDVVFLVYPNQSCDDNARVGIDADHPEASGQGQVNQSDPSKRRRG